MGVVSWFPNSYHIHSLLISVSRLFRIFGNCCDIAKCQIFPLLSKWILVLFYCKTWFAAVMGIDPTNLFLYSREA